MVERIRSEIQRIRFGESHGKRMSQAELDAYRRQLVLLGISVTAILVVVILGAGAYYQYVHLPRQTVAAVEDHEITRSDYWAFRRYDLLMQINQYQQFAQFMGGEQAQQYQQMAFQANQEFENISDAPIDPAALNEMINNWIVMNALDEFGLEITDEDIENHLVRYFTGMEIPGQDVPLAADPTAEAWATATAEAEPEVDPMQPDIEVDMNGDADAENGQDLNGDDGNGVNEDVDADEADDVVGDDAADDQVVGPEPTPEPEPTPSEEEIRATATAIQGQHEDNMLDRAGLSHDEFVELVIKPDIAREKLRRHLGDEIPTRSEQVHAAHILVATEEAAQLIHEELIGDDPRDFADAAEAQSTDTQTAQNGGDLGWFPRGVMVAEFEEVVFELDEGEISEPFQTQFGWHIVNVIERDDDRPVALEILQQLRQRAFEDWLEDRRAALEIDARDVALPAEPVGPPPTDFQPPPSAPAPPMPEMPEFDDQPPADPEGPAPVDDDPFDDLFTDEEPDQPDDD